MGCVAGSAGGDSVWHLDAGDGIQIIRKLLESQNLLNHLVLAATLVKVDQSWVGLVGVFHAWDNEKGEGKGD